MANFDSEFFGLVFPGFQATQKIHAQNSRPELSAFLSNFTFLNPKFIHGDFLLTGDPPFHAFFPKKRGLAEKSAVSLLLFALFCAFLAQKRLRSPVLEFSTHAFFVKTALF